LIYREFYLDYVLQIDDIFLMRPSVLGKIEKHNHQNNTNFGGSQFEFASNLYI